MRFPIKVFRIDFYLSGHTIGRTQADPFTRENIWQIPSLAGAGAWPTA